MKISMEEPTEKIFTVSEYIEILNTFLKREEIKLIGEVSQVQKAVSGHVYFSLKDQNSDAVMSSVIWKGNYMRCGINMEVGMELLLTGHPQIYAPTGRFSFVADTIELRGEGALKKAYDELKKKLEGEGLFAPERKRPLPELIHKIGVITSREGAVIHDFVNNLGKFGYEVNLVDSRVEGQQAVKSLIEAIHTLKKKDIEVLVIIRGGGSLESLQAFNNEALVREVVNFPVPVIAGIGHDKDVPLVALAADVMVSTPTAATHLINYSWQEAYAKIGQMSQILTRVAQEIKRIYADLELSWSSLLDHTAERIEVIKQKIAFAEQTIKFNDPTRQLKFGYSIVRKEGKVVKNIRGLEKGDSLNVQLSDGGVESTVDRVTI